MSLYTSTDELYARLEEVRRLHPALHNEAVELARSDAALDDLGYDSRVRLAHWLLAERNRRRSAREILDRLLRYAHARYPAQPRSVEDFERRREERRIVELRLIPDLIDEVSEATKTSSVRAGTVREIKTGRGLFRVAERNVTVPIVIEAVRFGERLDQLSDHDLRAQGPFVRNLLEREGRGAALDAIFTGMQRHYPGFARGDEVTVIYFRPLPN